MVPVLKGLHKVMISELAKTFDSKRRKQDTASSADGNYCDDVRIHNSKTIKTMHTLYKESQNYHLYIERLVKKQSSAQFTIKK